MSGQCQITFLILSVEDIFHDKNHPFVFQHDNALAHMARQTVRRLAQQHISLIQWPSQSPDLNIRTSLTSLGLYGQRDH